MKKILLTLAALAFASPAAAQSIVVVTAQSPDSRVLPVAFAELQAGANDAAVAKLTTSDVDARDPSRLINLGTAYARLGRSADARTAYEAAAASPIRYDLELADGTTMDSRWAARTALARLDQGRAQIALAR
ncbi:hypothetical protein [Sphingopyxis panaciterrulae]|uniref:Flp pilus assembly protein TadD n=1 Tax=Sphingopyxis panaciterrulae TaxID=462372 RepID=A0A7W9EP76_9SPHN|nr:hypothetical protein [Sphingopyxis panaciterrulae]MBB5705328.1 Flp pilus assembly protein TadD [Sphingopyxis panaciterrulae]